MTKRQQLSLRTFISRIISFSKKHKSFSQLKVFQDFIRIFYSHVDPNDFTHYSEEALASMARSMWQFMQGFSKRQIKVCAFNPSQESGGWDSDHAVLQVMSLDMPFLIDSIRIELNRLGITMYSLIFTGGMNVSRNSQHDITSVSAHGMRAPARSQVEAPIMIEIDKQPTRKLYKQIETNITRVLYDVLAAVEDWPMMQQKMQDSIEEISLETLPQDDAEILESRVFLEWLLDNHFTFLGVRDYKVTGRGQNRGLRLVRGSGLGVLRDDSRSLHNRLFSELRPKARELMLSKEHLLIISKTNTRSTVHRPTHTDYIGVKRYDNKGELIGERRFIGLYTSTAYHSMPSNIPFLRHKVASVMKRSALPPGSHAGKDLANILATMPRDDLFQATTDELYDISMGILHMHERRRTRLFLREDAYGRYVSCIVYIPRDNFNTIIMRKMQLILMETLKGLEISFNTYFSASVLACIHFVVRIDSKKRIRYNVDELEKQLIEAAQSWTDHFRQELLKHYGDVMGNRMFDKYAHAFPADYRESTTFKQVMFDVEKLEKISEDAPLEMSVYHDDSLPDDVIQFKLFRINHTIPLSDVLPVLENMGLRVIREEPYCIRLNDIQVWINDFTMTYSNGDYLQVKPVRNLFEQAFYRIWHGHAESDAFNRLVIDAHLDWHSIALLRAYTKYLRQVGFTFSFDYIAKTFLHNVQHAKLFIELFYLYFDPKLKRNENKVKQLEDRYVEELDNVAILDEDRILRRFLDLLHATLRINFFQKKHGRDYHDYIAIKLDSSSIPEMPRPLPRFEIFIYSPRFEGVHLRAHKVARGGLRWSDRQEDFRTEVLGLMKAQQVKNAVIVPSGAKGGFVPKRLPVKGSRHEILQEGIACYKDFIRGLLDITDNLHGDRIRAPKDTVCYDEPDPYLVVAADKGTATFSDIANSIAIEKGFWLGDAFASGGSTGYDHKKMGITARGAWVSAERQFQELGINVDDAEISVVGIGDMAGDVFGNGVLLSDKLQLVAAFNHLHIFLDPNPDPAKSFAERKRLFDLPRSSWEDYDRKLISKGGGVYKRSAKSIKLSPEIKKVLTVNKDSMTPNDLLKAILCAPVDMIWNGGIGTFVKASSETNQEVGDRSNDHVRVNGCDLRARVVCEGGNLGLTQLGRIEYELTSGGKINTDFIDNSAGVDCSDHEVNIKILLNKVVEQGLLSEKQRNQLLARMTHEIAELVLQDNYHQNEVISFAAYSSPKLLPSFMYYLEYMFDHKLIDRELQFLPDKQTLLDRRAAGIGLTKPELCVLLAYTKIVLEEKIRRCELPDDPYLEQYVKEAFPTILRKRYCEQMMNHRLKREIISTQISNHLVSDMGILFVYYLYDETGASISKIVRAYEVSKTIFAFDSFSADIESLDYVVNTRVQHDMRCEVIQLVRRACRWFIRNIDGEMDIAKAIEHYAKPIAHLFRRLPKLVIGNDKHEMDKARDKLIAEHVPAEIAARISSTVPMYHALNIVDVATRKNVPIVDVAKIYFVIVDRLDLLWFRREINHYVSDDHWSVLAKAAYKGDLDWIQRRLTQGVLSVSSSSHSISGKINVWFSKHELLLERWQNVLNHLRSTDNKEFAMLAVAMRELSDLAKQM